MKRSLVFKLVLGILLVSLMTYGTSAFFIFYLKPILAPDMSDWIYVSGVLILGVLWTGILGWIAARLIIQPLLRLTRIIDEVAQGNLNVTIPGYRAQDEIGRLHQSFAIMLENLRKMIADVSDNVSVTDRGVETLGTAIKQATSQIETIALTIDRMADGASMQANSAQNLLAAAEQSAKTAQSINSEAGHAIRITEEMVNTIGESASRIRSLVDGMQQVFKAGEKTLDIVRNLEHQAKEIGQISMLVGHIADQTHLLALNASIEAAHAGEHGQGFAVVAQHIRKLAAESAAAVEQINALVKQMQEQSVTVANETDKQVQLIRRETKTGEEARAVLDEVIASVNEAAAAMHSIVGQITAQSDQINGTFQMAKQIADTAVTISDGSSRIASAAQEQTAVMQEITASSELLRDEALHLKEKTVMFKL